MSCTNALASGISNNHEFNPASINKIVVSDFPNKQLSVLNGNLEYLYRDVYIPGPSDMDVEIYRKLSINYGNNDLK